MNQVTVFNPAANRPAFARTGEVSAIARALAGGGTTGRRLSIKGGVFRLMVDGKEITAIDERYLDVAIVNAAPKVARVFYAGAYVEGQATAPTCFSSDGNAPDASVHAPQNSACATCPQNAKGSGQGESKACRYSQYLAVVLANDMTSEPMQLALAAMSIFGKAEGENRPLQDYVRYMLAQGIDVTQLITRLKFDTKSPVPKLFFKPMRWLAQEEFDLCQAQGVTPEAIKAITMTVSQTDGVVAAPAPLALPGKPPAKPAPVAPPEPEEEEEEAPPPPPPPPPAPAKPRKPRAAAPAAPAPLPPEPEEAPPAPTVRTAPAPAASRAPATTSLAQTLAEWDDE